jgi:uncharacterized membrane protein (UPF0136 family)
MKAYIFSIIMNFIAAVVLLGAGSLEMNNLPTSLPAIFCVLAGICGLFSLYKRKK